MAACTYMSSSAALAAEEFRAVSHAKWEAERGEAGSCTATVMINTGSAAIRKLEQKGREHQQLRQYSAASSCYRQSLMMAREMGHLPGESTAMASLRRLRRVLVRAAAVAHSPAQAVEYSSTALDAARLVEDRVGEKAALSTLAELYGKLGQFDAAIQHMERALAIAEEDGGGVGGDVASGAPKLRRALHLLCLGAERAQEEEAADRAFRALISTKPRAIEVAAAAAAVPELEPEPELRAHPPSDPGPARSAAVTQRARAWEALESPGRDHHAHALIKGRRAWLTTPSTQQQQQQQQQQVQLHSPRSHRSDDGGDVAADVRRPRPPAPPALDNSSSSSVFGSSSTRGPPSSLSSPSAPGTPLSLSASSASPSGHSQQHSAHESLESMLEEKRTLASRWHPPMVLPAFYWSSHYYHSLALLCADNTNSNSKSGNGGGDADVGVELTQYSHSQYKQALSEEGAALRRKLERSAAKAIKAAAADGSGSSSSSSSSSGRKEGLSTAALARRARKAGIATERIDAALQLSSSSSASSSGSDGGSAIGVVGAGATASSTGSIVVSSASANAALIDLLVEQHVGQADAFMAKYFNQ